MIPRQTRADTVAVIPSFNEDAHIAGVISKVKGFVSEVIVVDDGSADSTLEIAHDAGATVLRHIVNMGKGAALKTGCDYAVLHGAKKIIVLDADAQHDPSHIPSFIECLQDNDVALGFRSFHLSMPLILRIGNTFINILTRLLYGMKVFDTQSGYRGFSAKAYKKIRWDSNDYSMESEMIANIGKAKLSFCQIPIKTIYSDKYKGTTIIDGFKIVLNMIWWRLKG